MTYAVDDLFDLSQTTHGALFDGVQYPWDALKRLAGYLTQNLKPGCTGAEVHTAAHVGPQGFIGAGTIVEPGAPDESFLESLGHEVLARDPCPVVLVESAQGEGNQDTLRYRWWRLNCPVTHFDAHGRVDVCRMIGQIGLAEEASCSAS